MQWKSLRRAVVRIIYLTGWGWLATCSPPLTAQQDIHSSPVSSKANAAQALAPAASTSELRDDELEWCSRLSLDADQIEELRRKPLYKFTEVEVDAYLRFLRASQPNLRRRVAELARKNIGQPYEIYLLGEMPFEHYDPQPIYCLSKSDCVVFAEHTYAMALAHDWPSFMRLLQRIRYREGRIGVATRNHYTEADWNPSNGWLVGDVTRELAGDQAIEFRQKIDRAGFLKKRYQLDVEIPVEDFRDVYIPFLAVEQVAAELQDGDVVNVVRGRPAAPNAAASHSAWVGHVGMILRGPDGTVNMIHSAKPAVREEPLQQYIADAKSTMAEKDRAGKARLLGFKFLRLQEDPLGKLREVDGAAAPQIYLPSTRRPN